MTQPTREQLNELADKWLKGTLSIQEKELLDKWYDLDTAEPINWKGQDESEEELNARLLRNIQKRKESIVPFKRRWQLPAAAILLISLSISAYFYFSKPNMIKEQTAVLNHINPGKNKAILTLANGQKISLSDAVNGQVALQSGVRISKTADGQLIYEAAANGSKETTSPQYNTIEAPAGGQWQVKLPDGSHVWLNALSRIKYPTKFTGNERKIELTGEAYFEVAHNKAMPFKVVSNGQTIEVLGTHFNVMAYADENVMKTTLLEGSVTVSDNGKMQLLKPGEQAQVTESNIKVSHDVDLEDVIAWKNGYFKFNENLESIMKKISRWYNVEIVYEAKPDPKLGFGGEISRTRTIAEVLNVIQYSGKVHFKIEGRSVIVMK